MIQKEIYFKKYDGIETEVTLSVCEELENADRVSIVGIASKAFLSCKSVQRLVLPATLEVVEDWAFAHMKNLREISFPVKKISFGRKVFLGCDKLERVSLQTDKKVYEGIFYLLASMFCFFPEEELMHLELMHDTEGQKGWLAMYDAALVQYMERSDDYGFEPAFIGWFDIEDVDDQRQKYMFKQQRQKVLLAFQRLRYAQKLSENTKQYLCDYLLQKHTYIEELLFEEDSVIGRDVQYYKIWHQAGGLDWIQAGELLSKVSEENAEIRAYLLKLQLDEKEQGDLFAGFEL